MNPVVETWVRDFVAQTWARDRAHVGRMFLTKTIEAAVAAELPRLEQVVASQILNDLAKQIGARNAAVDAINKRKNLRSPPRPARAPSVA